MLNFVSTSVINFSMYCMKEKSLVVRWLLRHVDHWLSRNNYQSAILLAFPSNFQKAWKQT
jgi:hypothetical protein